jgi:hypothetical protein
VKGGEAEGEGGVGKEIGVRDSVREGERGSGRKRVERERWIERIKEARESKRERQKERERERERKKNKGDKRKEEGEGVKRERERKINGDKREPERERRL